VSPGPEDGDSPEEARRRRTLTDAQELRALTHPVRIALLEALHLDGPLTATEAGERIGESATTCSFHLRQLAKYGFVEEAGGGTGRRRPWRLVAREMSFSGMGDAEMSVAADELSTLLLRRWLARYEQWRRLEHLDPDWAEVSGASDRVGYVTREELTELMESIGALWAAFSERSEDPSLRPEGSRAVEMVALTHPIVDFRAATGSAVRSERDEREG
jgi:DNA-binding transcriptional ArsR family regulator